MGQESTSLPRLTSFSTRNAPRGDEVDYWHQVRREAYVSVRTDPVGAGFGGEIRLGQYADFRLSTKRARAEEVRRSRSDIAQAHDEQDYLYFLFQTRGTLLVDGMTPGEYRELAALEAVPTEIDQDPVHE